MTDEVPVSDVADLNDLFEHAPCGYLALNPAGRIIKANATISSWTGYATDELHGKRLVDFLTIPGRIYYETHFAPLLRMQGHFNEVALDLVGKAGARLPVLVNASERRGADGKPLITRVTVFNSTDRRRYERELLEARAEAIAASEKIAELNATLEASVAEEVARRLAAEEAQLQSQKVESLGRLTGGIAHDFNNMLAVIMGALGLIERRHKRGQEIGDLLSGAMDGARRAAELTQRLLAFSRQAPLELQVIDVNGLVTRLSEILSRTLGEDVPIDMVLTAGLWSALTDRGQLENVILNLAINARDAMPGGGKITIETANAELDERYARANVDVVPGQYVMLAVSDTGTGMPADVLKRAFEPFFTTKDVGKGTGLGLSQIFGYVKQANGHVKIESEVGRGTVVRIYLPRHTGADRALPQDTPSTDVVAVAERTVLIVEDDVRLRSITSANLQELGYAVLVAASAQDALDVIRGPRAIDLLFTDVVMPGMNGRQLADEAVKLRPALKVLFTTGFTNQSDAHSDILDKTAIYLAKPFSFEQLGQKVRSILA